MRTLTLTIFTSITGFEIFHELFINTLLIIYVFTLVHEDKVEQKELLMDQSLL